MKCRNGVGGVAVGGGIYLLTQHGAASNDAGAVEAIERLAPGDVALLREVIAKRQPDLIPLVERIGTTPLNDFERSRLRRVVVDELCEHLAPGARADRRDLALSDLLLHLGTA